MSHRRKRYLLICFTSLVFGFVQGYSIHKDHLLLKESGELAEVFDVVFKVSDVDGNEFVKYSFKTSSGQLLTESNIKSDNKNYYENLQVIYNPLNPVEFQELPEFERYSVTWTLIFMGVLFPCSTTFILGGFSDFWFDGKFGQEYNREAVNKTPNESEGL